MNNTWYLLFALVFVALTNQDDKLTASKARGEDIYTDFCIACHMANGEGVPGAFPPLAGSDYLFEKTDAAIRGVKYGQQGELIVNGITYNGIMTPLYLADDEVMDVMNFILNSWGNQGEFITLERVKSIIKNE